MTLLSYHVFKCVAELGSFKRAAEVLGLTPSAISHAVSSLEAELGFAVVTRNKNGVTLTNQGEELLPYVNALIHSEEGINQVVDNLKGLKSGAVKLGVFSSVCTQWLPTLLASFKKKYPGVTVEVFQGTYDDVRYWIKNGIVDLGFLSVSAAGDLPIEPLYRDPLYCVVPKGMPHKKDKPYFDIDDMRGLEFVTQRESTDADIQNFLRENRLTVQSNFHVVDDLATVSLVAAGMGICLMPELCMRNIDYEVDMYPVYPRSARIIGVATSNPDFLSPAAKRMKEEIIERFKKI